MKTFPPPISIAERANEICLHGARVMVVGQIGDLEGLAMDGVSESIVALPFARLTPAILAEARPDLVFAPLLAPGFDIVDVGTRLRAAGYAGRLYAFSAPLPNRESVLCELQAQFPTIDVRLVFAGAAEREISCQSRR